MASGSLNLKVRWSHTKSYRAMSFNIYATVEEMLDIIITRNELPYAASDLAVFVPPNDVRPGAWLERTATLAAAGLVDRVRRPPGGRALELPSIDSGTVSGLVRALSLTLVPRAGSRSCRTLSRSRISPMQSMCAILMVRRIGYKSSSLMTAAAMCSRPCWWTFAIRSPSSCHSSSDACALAT